MWRVCYLNQTHKENTMLYWAVVFFLIIAMVAGMFGFGAIVSTSVGIAQFLFFAFVVLFILAAAIEELRRLD